MRVVNTTDWRIRERDGIAAVLASSNSVKAEYLAWHLEPGDLFSPVFKRYASLEEA